MRPLLITLLLFCAPTFGQQIRFRANLIADIPENAILVGSLLQGDFTNDGKRDVAVVVSNEILVYPQNSSGSLDAPIVTAIPALNYVYAVAGDFNRDGYLDLVLLESTYGDNINQFVTMIGNGSGTFVPLAPSITPSIPNLLVTADFNHDGVADIAWVSNDGYASRSLEVQTGVGDGTFQAPVSTPLAAEVWAIANGDFNNDGQTDLALVEGPPSNIGAVQILFGNGLASFPVTETLLPNLGSNLDSIAAGHLNGDKNLDLVVSTYTGYAVLLGKGNGLFAAPVQYPSGGGGVVSLADINGDGHADILLVNTGDFSGLAYAFGEGDGTFGPLISTYQEAGLIVAADFSGGGISDVAALLQYGEEDIQVSLILGSHLGLVVAPTVPQSTTAYSGPVTADFNLDGKADFTVVTEAGIAVWLGDGHGHFHQTATLADIPYGIVVGDFNGDNIPDIAEGPLGGAFGPGFVKVFFGVGDGTFSAPVTSAGPPLPADPVAADFNGDGKLDIAFTSDPGYNPEAKGSVAVQLGNGDGTFSAPSIYIGNKFPGSLAVADLNGDGYLDVAFTNFESGAVSVLVGKGDGNFEPAVIVAHTDSPSQVQAIDVNGDGRPDLLVGTAATVSVFLNEPNGVFQLSPSGAPFGYSLVVADLNGDGIPDLAASNGVAVSIQEGNGDGTFQAPVEYGVFADYLAVGRFYGGSVPDISMTDYGGAVAFLVNITGRN